MFYTKGIAQPKTIDCTTTWLKKSILTIKNHMLQDLSQNYIYYRKSLCFVWACNLNLNLLNFKTEPRVNFFDSWEKNYVYCLSWSRPCNKKVYQAILCKKPTPSLQRGSEREYIRFCKLNKGPLFWFNCVVESSRKRYYFVNLICLCGFIIRLFRIFCENVILTHAK